MSGTMVCFNDSAWSSTNTTILNKNMRIIDFSAIDITLRGNQKRLPL